METDTQTDRHTDTQTKYRNPRSACAPRVNKTGGSDGLVGELLKYGGSGMIDLLQ